MAIVGAVKVFNDGTSVNLARFVTHPEYDVSRVVHIVGHQNQCSSFSSRTSFSETTLRLSRL